MSRPADPMMRTALLETAARLISAEGSAGLTLRRLVDEVGTSTMAVYTHFGGMDELRRALRREGFARFAAHLAEVSYGSDPVEDLTVLGWAYHRSAATSPHLYRVMFMEQPLDELDADVGRDTLDVLLRAVDRCITSGRFHPVDPAELAAQLWAVAHGLVALRLARIISARQTSDQLLAAVESLYRGYGDDPRAAASSVAAARRTTGLDRQKSV